MAQDKEGKKDGKINEDPSRLFRDKSVNFEALKPHHMQLRISHCESGLTNISDNIRLKQKEIHIDQEVCPHKVGCSQIAMIEKLQRQLDNTQEKPVEDHSHLDVEEYLGKTVLPILVDALEEIGTTRPANPLHSLAVYLLRNSHKY